MLTDRTFDLKNVWLNAEINMNLDNTSLVFFSGSSC